MSSRVKKYLVFSSKLRIFSVSNFLTTWKGTFGIDLAAWVKPHDTSFKPPANKPSHYLPHKSKSDMCRIIITSGVWVAQWYVPFVVSDDMHLNVTGLESSEGRTSMLPNTTGTWLQLQAVTLSVARCVHVCFWFANNSSDTCYTYIDLSTGNS